MGLAVIALSSAGSTLATSPKNRADRLSSEMQEILVDGRRAFEDGRYGDARQLFIKGANKAVAAGLPAQAAMSWNNAGGASIATRQFRDAMENFQRARRIAMRSKSWKALAYTKSNLASLYLQMLNPEAAAETAREALAGPEGHADPSSTTTLRLQLANALARLHQFDSALPLFRQAIFEVEDSGDLEKTAAFWSTLGDAATLADRNNLAETAFTEALHLIRVHRLKNAAPALRGMARIKSGIGDYHSAAVLYDAAVNEPPGFGTRWVSLTARGRFLLERGKPDAALRDFRDAWQMVSTLRADMVPADQDRITLESGIGDLLDGLVDAGNRLATRTHEAQLIEESFNTAEQNRAWSLRALIPTEGDWRSRLPTDYWEILARYQRVQRIATAQGKVGQSADSIRLSLQLANLEASAARSNEIVNDSGISAVRHAQELLDDDSLLLSFHIGQREAWVWVVEKNDINVFSLGDSSALQNAAASVSTSVRGGTVSEPALHDMFDRLFGSIPEPHLRHARWLLELDAVLFEVPFGALITDLRNPPIYLPQRAAIQIVPGALLLKRGNVPRTGEFVGIGDAVYNLADSRYRGPRLSPQIVLARLPNTATELQNCAREWSSERSLILTGTNVNERSVLNAMREEATILHFATHIVTSPADHHSGIIALGLDRTGTMGLLGTREILARPVHAALVVMNGCHSSQANSLPSSGLMGLTRAWMGAGASAVLATQWDIPDLTSQEFLAAFYRALRTVANFDPTIALQQAQLITLRGAQPSGTLKNWAGYFLFSRLVGAN